MLQFAELHLAADMITLLAADLGGLPFAISSMVAAGGMAAALSTADSLLLTISNALVHDHSAPLDKRIAARLGVESVTPEQMRDAYAGPPNPLRAACLDAMGESLMDF